MCQGRSNLPETFTRVHSKISSQLIGRRHLTAAGKPNDSLLSLGHRTVEKLKKRNNLRSEKSKFEDLLTILFYFFL